VRPARKADNLTSICEPIVYKMWDPQCLTTLWAFAAWYRDSFTFTFTLPYLKADLVFCPFMNWITLYISRH
jgi:hypothetical protein